MNLEGVLPVVRGKLKNETVATFYDVYDVSGPEFGPFFNFPSGLKVIDLFKAKMEAFRERNCEKAEKGLFFLILSRKKACEMKPVFEEKFPEPSAKPVLIGTFC